MANRGVTESGMRQVTNVVADRGSGILEAGTALLGIAQQHLDVAEQAKINDHLANVNLELNALNNQYQIDFESNPASGLPQYKKDRQAVFDKYGSDVSPVYKKAWQQKTRDMGNRDNIGMQTWSIRQSKVNTQNSINNSIKKNLQLASIAGQNFANGDTSDIESFMNFTSARAELEQFGDANLGETSTDKLLSDFEEDSIKSFIGGVADIDPVKALQIMDNEGIKNQFKDQKQYLGMKNALENKALNVGKFNAENEILDVLKSENNLLTQSAQGERLSYDKLQQIYSEQGTGKNAQEFFNKLNGFGKKKKLSNSDQMIAKSELYDDLRVLGNEENLTSGMVSKFQDRIYKAMNNGTLSEKEGSEFIVQITNPLVENKEEMLKQYSDYNWFSADIGFGGIEDYYNNEVAIVPSEGEEEVGIVSQDINNRNKNKLYDFYMNALKDEATKINTNVVGVSNLSKNEQVKLYSSAQAQAKRDYLLSSNPKLRDLTDIPNKILGSKVGVMVQGMAGDRDLTPNNTVNSPFKNQIGSDGFLYRLYPDGTREKLGKAPEGVNF